jgi:hypothetical protein
MKALFVLMAASVVVFVCRGDPIKNKKVPFSSLQDVPDSSWRALSTKKIYFGHQSVGDNIIKGMASIMKANPSTQLEVTEVKPPEAMERPSFFHSSIGQNDDPLSKVRAFKEYVQDGIGNSADIAFFKFCFWDIREKTDVKTIFAEYRETLAVLKSRYPGTTFVHVTVPLMAYAEGIKDRVQRAFGVASEFDKDHARRHELNELILNEYLNREPVFDLALVESTLPDGSRTGFSRNGKTYYTLASEYTRDGGHLNDQGQRRVAEQFLIFLAKLASKAEG